MVDLSYQASVEPDALPGRAYPRIGEGPGPEPFGGEIGRGIENVGEAVQRHVDQAMQFARESQHADGVNQLQATAVDISHNPQSGFLTLQGKDAFGLDSNPNYLPKFDDQAQKIIDAAPDPRVKVALQQSYGHIRNQLTEQMDSHELEQHKQFGIQTAKSSVELAQQNAQANYNHPDIVDSARDSIDYSVDRIAKQLGWSDEQVQEAKYSEHSKLNQGVIQNMLADKKPEMAQAYLDHIGGELKPAEREIFEKAIRGGQVDASVQPIAAAYQQGTSIGEKQLSQFMANSNLDADQKAQVLEGVEKQNRAYTYAQAQKYDKSITGLYTDIAGKNTGPETASKADFLYEKGALSTEQHRSVMDAITRTQTAQNEDDRGLSMADSAYKDGTKLDPKDGYASKAMNLYFEELTNGQKPGSTGYVSMAESVLDKTGIIPHDIVSYSRAQLLSGEPADAANAAAMLDRLQRVNPRAYSEAVDDKGLAAMAHTINAAVSAGTDPKVAIEMARENSQRSPTEDKFLDQQWTKQNNFTPSSNHAQIESDALRKGLADDPYFASQGFLSHLGVGDKVPQPPLSMTSEFQTLTREYFNHTGGNLAQSRQLAINDLKGTWGVSEVNGGRELMKYAPERMFPGLTSDMVRGDVRTSAPDAQDPHLVESPETAVSGGKNWYIASKDQFGAYDVARDKDGLPLRYELPNPTAAMVHAASEKRLADQQRLVLRQKENEKESEELQGNAELGNE